MNRAAPTTHEVGAVSRFGECDKCPGAFVFSVAGSPAFSLPQSTPLITAQPTQISVTVSWSGR